MDNARLFSHLSCGYRPGLLPLARHPSHFARFPSQYLPADPCWASVSAYTNGYKRLTNCRGDVVLSEPRPPRLYRNWLSSSHTRASQRALARQAVGGCRTLTTLTMCWCKAVPAAIAANYMQSRIAPPLRSGPPLSPATPGPRAARSGRDGARGCRLVERPLIACRKKGWEWPSPYAWASRLAARQPRKGVAARSRCGNRGTAANGGGCPRPCAVGSAVVHGWTREARHAMPTDGCKPPSTVWRIRRARTPITPAHHPSAAVHVDFIAQKSNVGPLSGQHVGQGGAG